MCVGGGVLSLATFGDKFQTTNQFTEDSLSSWGQKLIFESVVNVGLS